MIVGSGGGIKSIQRGTSVHNFNTSSTFGVTIAGVNPAKCSVKAVGAFSVAGVNGSGSAAYRKFYVNVDSISETEIVFSGASNNENIVWSWEVLEYV